MEDITAGDAAVIVSSSDHVTAIGVPNASSLSANNLGVHLIGAEAIGSMTKWVRADCSLAILQRHGIDALRDVSRISGIGAGTLQNAATTALSWPYGMRQSGRYQTYSHHQALNALNDAEKLRYLHLCAEQGLSVSRLRGMVSGRVDASEASSIETVWEVNQRRIDHWRSATGIQIERTRETLTLEVNDNQLTFRAVVLPSGLAAIELGESK